MAIVYTYPVTNKPSVDDLLVISKKNPPTNKTMNTEITDVIGLAPTILDIDDFPFYGEPFGDLGKTPVAGDTINYNGTAWVPGPAGTSKTEVISVNAFYDAATNVFSGDGTPPATSYDTVVIYKVIFASTNTLAASSLNIQLLGDVPLVAPDQSGVLQPIEAGFIQAGTIYYLSYLANTFQISTTAPTPTNNSVEYSNSLPVSIAEDVGGVKAGAGENWAPIQDGVDDQGNPIYRGYTLTEIMNRIFYPYQNPAFETFKIVGQATNVEVGSTVTGGDKPFQWTWNEYSSNIEDNTLSINDITNPPNTNNPIIENASTDPAPATLLANIGSDIIKTQETFHRWRASALTTTDNPAGQQTIPSDAFTIRWHYKWYYGASENETLTPAEITTLLAGVLGSTRSANVMIDARGNGSIGQYWYLAYPNNWGNLNNWRSGGNDVSTGPIGAPYNLDQGGTDGFRFYAEVTGVPVPNSPSVTYRVYRTKQLQNGNIPVLISI